MKKKQDTSIWHLAGVPALVCYVVLTPLSAAASGVFALSLQPVTDNAVNWNPVHFWTSCIWALLLALADTILNHCLRVQRANMVNRCTRQLGTSTFRLMLHQNPAHFSDQDSAFYLSQLSTQVPLIASRYLGSALELYRCFWSLVISFVVMARAGWELTIYVVACSLVSIYLPKCLQKKSTQAEQAYLDANQAQIAQASEGLSNFFLIRLHHLFGVQETAYGQCAAEVERRDDHRQSLLITMDSLSTGISQLSFVLILAGCVLLVIHGRMSVGYTMSITQLLGGIMVPFEMVPGLWMALGTGKSLYQDHLAQLTNHLDMPGTVSLPHPPQRIHLDDVSFSYPKHGPVLEHISLQLDCTKKYALVGESGCGKSTLAKLIMGFLSPTHGRIDVDEIPLEQLLKEDYYHTVGYQSQGFSCFRGTIQDNIFLRRCPSPGECDALLHQVSLDRWLSTLPDGSRTQITENGKNLSGGQAQRVALARCLAGHPSFLVLDEITAALDAATAAALEDTILSLEGVGLLLITHRLSSQNLKHFDSILLMEDGTIVEQGSWRELMAQKGSFYRLVTQNK